MHLFLFFNLLLAEILKLHLLVIKIIVRILNLIELLNLRHFEDFSFWGLILRVKNLTLTYWHLPFVWSLPEIEVARRNFNLIINSSPTVILCELWLWVVFRLEEILIGELARGSSLAEWYLLYSMNLSRSINSVWRFLRLHICLVFEDWNYKLLI